MAIQHVLDHGMYIMGPEVRSSRTASLNLVGSKTRHFLRKWNRCLRSCFDPKGVEKGDAIFVPSFFTFAATAEVVAWVGATPVFIDSLEDTFNIDPQSLKNGIKKAKELGLP